MSEPRPVVTLLSDYGVIDEFVGVCHGVIKSIAPDAELIDITHGIAPQHVLQGALVLAETLPFMPVGVHLAVVDPGVGGERRPVAIRCGDGRLLVGPDNGLLLLAAERVGGVAEVVELTNRRYMLDTVSATFHGRDVFAPAAAHLANGVELSALGPAMDGEVLVRVELPAPRIEEDNLHTTVVLVDRFGNVRLNVAPGELRAAAIASGDSIDVEVDGRHYTAQVASTFADVGLGKLLVYEDSSRTISLAINRGSAARLLGVVTGQGVILHPPGGA
jgi:S-adenosyl-L-methionine hydrolase (adenosine-forming)